MRATSICTERSKPKGAPNLHDGVPELLVPALDKLRAARSGLDVALALDGVPSALWGGVAAHMATRPNMFDATTITEAVRYIGAVRIARAIGAARAANIMDRYG